MPDPALLRRARGAILGHAVGALLTPDGTVDSASGRVIELRLSGALAEELIGPEMDIHRLATRWATLAAEDGAGLDPWTRAALAHIRTHDAPPGALGTGAGPAALCRTLPLVLATLGQPANLVSGAYHLTTLTHPDEEFGWGAVAVQLAIAVLVQGRRDFLPDVLEVLRNNAAPDSLMHSLRRLPVARREELPPLVDGAVSGVVVSLWLAQHEPDLERGLTWLVADEGRRSATIVAAALLGARDGDGAFPDRWTSAVPDLDRLRRQAEQLVS